MGFSAWPLATSLAETLAETPAGTQIGVPICFTEYPQPSSLAAELWTPCCPVHFVGHETLCYQRVTHTHTHTRTHLHTRIAVQHCQGRLPGRATWPAQSRRVLRHFLAHDRLWQRTALQASLPSAIYMIPVGGMGHQQPNGPFSST